MHLHRWPLNRGVWEEWKSVVGGVEVCDGRVRCVGVVKVCGIVLEMGQ